MRGAATMIEAVISGPTTSTRPACSAHEGSPAGWWCEICDVRQCVECARRLRGIAVCGTCGRAVETLKGPREVVEPLSATWHLQLSELRSQRAAFWLLLFTCAFELLVSVHSAKLWFLGWLLLLAWVVFTMRRAGLAVDLFARPTYDDLFSVWSGPMVRVSPVVVPLAVAAFWLVDAGRGAVELFSTTDLVVVLVALPLLTVALPVAAIEGPGRTWAFPWGLVRLWWTTHGGWRPLLELMAVAGALVLVADRQLPLDMEDTNMFSAIVARFVVHLGMVVALTAFGLVAGQWLLTWAGVVDHRNGEPADLPWLHAVPIEAWQPKLPTEAEVAAKDAARFVPIELEDPLVVFGAAVREGRAAEAMKQLNRGEVVLSAVSGELLILLAQSLVARGDANGAARLLETLVARQNDPGLARGTVIFARLLEERLEQAARALSLYQQVVQQFPGTPAAEFAARRLTDSNHPAPSEPAGPS